MPFSIEDLKLNVSGHFGNGTLEETSTTESSRRVIRNSIAVTTNASVGTKASTQVTWYLVNKQGYIETNINGTLNQVPFSITDTLEADQVSLPPEICDSN